MTGREFVVRSTDDWDSQARDFAHGDAVLLHPGRYDRPLRLSRRKQAGDKRLWLTIRMSGAGWISCGRQPDFKWRLPPEGYDADKNPAPDRSGPPKPLLSDFAFLQIDECADILLEGLFVRDSWPSIVFIQDSQRVIVRDCRFEGGTYAIFAKSSGKGSARADNHRDTSHLLIEGCAWRQDASEGRDLWRRIRWDRAHGGEKADGRYRHFNGGFLAGKDIGQVVIRANVISDCYNGIRLKGSIPKPFAAPVSNTGVHIYGNLFQRVRDNPIEPEAFAMDWHVRHNTLEDCHSWFSVDGVAGGYFYFYGNTGTFTSRQGPSPAEGGDPGEPHTMGRVLKLSYRALDPAGKPDPEMSKDGVPHKPWYVFNNSWFLRCPIVGGENPTLKPGSQGPDFTAKLFFLNNAFEWAKADPGDSWTNVAIPPINNMSLVECTGVTFDYNVWTDWQGYSYPGMELSQVFERHGRRSAGPLFEDGKHGNFTLAPGGLASKSGCDFPLEALGGTDATIRVNPDGTLDRGAMQDYGRVSVAILEARARTILDVLGVSSEPRGWSPPVS